MRIQPALVLSLMLASLPASARDIRIAVFGLFHPRRLTIVASSGEAVVIHAGTHSFTLERSSGRFMTDVRVSSGAMLLQIADETVEASQIHITHRSNGPVDFVLSIPGKISRHYRGTLDVTIAVETLLPVVSMDLETAVASAVLAESLPGTPLEALKAQAVATRSYFSAAKQRHFNFDFCDTTHCQFLREVPDSNTPAANATSATRGLVLAYRDQPFGAMFTRSCGGRTRTPVEVHLSSQSYPYFAVSCDYCSRHPSRWQSQVSPHDLDELLRDGEAARLEIGRRVGWDVVPSNNFTVHSKNQKEILEGSGEGHGIGLCQRGAKAMAEEGASFRDILNHYYPNTTLIQPSTP